MDIDDFSKGFAATENTLFFTLLTARMWATAPQSYDKALERQSKVVREREWPCHFFDETLMVSKMVVSVGDCDGEDDAPPQLA